VETPQDRNFIFIRIKHDSGKIFKIIKASLDVEDEMTLGDTLEDALGEKECTKSVHVDDDLFSWNEIKTLYPSDLPILCGDRKMFTFTFVKRKLNNSKK
jgi:hypothetical protein